MQHKISSGIDGLDHILKGGLVPQRSYLITGGPGTGKSTLGYHFLREGAQKGEETLYITLGESEHMILDNAEKVGLDLTDIHFLDLSPSEDLHENTKDYSVFPTSEVEQRPIVDAIVDTFKKLQPKRVVLDSITMLRFLNQDDFKFRNFGLSLVNFICSNGATLFMISESTAKNSQDSAFWVDGIINLEYSPEWRKLSVSKYRGSDFLHGNHAFRITDQGTTVFPRLQPNNYDRKFANQTLSTGIDEIDKLLDGGIEKGTTTMITGPSGVGKTNLGLQILKEAASRGHRSTLYTFEESRELITRRSEQINIPIKAMVDDENLQILPVEPLSYSPDEFAYMVRRDVEQHDTRMVMVDSLGGYGMAVREEETLERLHALTVYLQNMGITTLLINEIPNVTGEFITSNMHASYLADNIIFLRYLEISGELQKAIGVLKKRLSDFEKTIRQYQITPEGIKVGRPLTDLHGILSGVPTSIK